MHSGSGNYTVSTTALSFKLSLKSSLLVTWYSTGWSIERCNEHCIRLKHSTSGQIDLLVVSLILDRDLEQEKRLQQELVQALNTLESLYRVGLTIRTRCRLTWIYQRLSASPRNGWQKPMPQADQKQRRVGYVKDALCHLDFRIIGPKEQQDESTVYLVTPPVIGPKLQRNLLHMMSQSVEVLRQQRPQENDVPSCSPSSPINRCTSLKEHGKSCCTVSVTKNLTGQPYWTPGISVDGSKTHLEPLLAVYYAQSIHSNPPAMSLVLTPSCLPILVRVSHRPIFPTPTGLPIL